MPLINQLLDGAVLVARQASDTAITGASSVASATFPATDTATSAATGLPTNTFMPSTAFFSPLPSGTTAPTTTATSGSGSGSSSGGGGGSSPLLFFVALGFGVVFTNLWIIVGVKYCFRYNARARQMRQAAEDGDPINLENMPRPHRRRREKKLMTIDEVNEKFPMLKYKNWVASRARDGLPTRGGVDAPSRPNSVRSVEGVIPDLQPKERDSTDETDDKRRHDVLAATTSVSDTPAAASNKDTAAVQDASSSDAKTDAGLAAGRSPYGDYPARHSDDHSRHTDDDDDEHIDAALPPECVGTSGDTCAICIDTLEDDDDVRGLTCGHAFHAVCLDPWLTSRRACCPLCKADYYTPKPRVPPADAGDAPGTPGIVAVSSSNSGDARNQRYNRSNGGWRTLRGPGGFFGNRSQSDGQGNQSPAAGSAQLAAGAAGASMPAPPAPAAAGSRRGFFGRRRQDAATGGRDATGTAGTAAAAGSASNSSWLPSGFRNPLRRQDNGSQAQPAGAPAAQVTPSQLEAGVRNELRS